MLKNMIGTFIAILAFAIINQNQVLAGEYNVYSPRVYAQLQKLNQPINMGTTASKNKTQLLVDYSGSMSTWIKIGVETLEEVLPKLSRHSSVGLRTFSGSLKNGEFGKTCKTTHKLADFSRNNSSTIVSGLKTVKTGGSTPIEFALRTTVTMDFDKGKTNHRYNRNKKKIILVTDGEDTCGGDPCAYIRELMSERSDIVIDVIQLGDNQKLACLANQTGGKHYNVQVTSEFKAALEESIETNDGIYELSSENETLYQEREPIYEEEEEKVEQQPTMTRGYKFVDYE